MDHFQKKYALKRSALFATLMAVIPLVCILLLFSIDVLQGKRAIDSFPFLRVFLSSSVIWIGCFLFCFLKYRSLFNKFSSEDEDLEDAEETDGNDSDEENHL